MLSNERTRFVYQWWERECDGKRLTRNHNNTPRGKRTPNGAVWGHSIDDFFMIQRVPGVNVVTCYSRSMIKELDEGPIDDGDEPDAPRIRRPYPLLKIDKGVECPESSKYSCFDGGSDHGDPIPVEDPEDGGTKDGHDTKAKVNDPKGKMRADYSPPKPKQEYIYQGKRGFIHHSLEEDIPEQFFPDQLIVTDPYSLAFGEGEKSKDDARSPWIYERLYPSFDRDLSSDRFAEDPVTAELNLDPSQPIGIGNHSRVYRATFTLPKGLSARTPDGKVTVVAKISFPDHEDRYLLHNEAKIFSSFPKDLSQEWCGFNMIAPLAWPVPVGPVVPKLYGYYMPTGEKKDTLSPILLMEECGTPINPRALTLDEKTECHSLYLRLHSEGYIHNSTYIRNIVMQPGPLTRHPQERSLLTPSFRLIDFGRSTNIEVHVARMKFKEGLTEEEIQAEKEKEYRAWAMTKSMEGVRIHNELGVGPQFHLS